MWIFDVYYITAKAETLLLISWGSAILCVSVCMCVHVCVCACVYMCVHVCVCVCGIRSESGGHPRRNLSGRFPSPPSLSLFLFFFLCANNEMLSANCCHSHWWGGEGKMDLEGVREELGLRDSLLCLSLSLCLSSSLFFFLSNWLWEILGQDSPVVIGILYWRFSFVKGEEGKKSWVCEILLAIYGIFFSSLPPPPPHPLTVVIWKFFAILWRCWDLSEFWRISLQKLS